MTTNAEKLDDLFDRLERAVTGAEHLSTPFFMARIIANMQDALIRSTSPWLNRSDAAAYWRCSESEIDAAARAGVLTKHMRVGTPMFLKSQGDEAIKSGKWVKSK